MCVENFADLLELKETQMQMSYYKPQNIHVDYRMNFLTGSLVSAGPLDVFK